MIVSALLVVPALVECLCWIGFRIKNDIFYCSFMAKRTKTLGEFKALGSVEEYGLLGRKLNSPKPPGS